MTTPITHMRYILIQPLGDSWRISSSVRGENRTVVTRNATAVREFQSDDIVLIRRGYVTLRNELKAL